MNCKPATAVWIASALAASSVFTIGLAAQSAPGAPKLTQEAFKNIKVLKDLPADELQPAMQFISASLGVECDFCHVQRQFEKDDKKPKETARRMIQMTLAINKDHFKGEREVTCYSCHRGSPDPAGIPVIREEEPRPALKDTARAENPGLPSADQIVSRYIAALGGTEALQKITSRVEAGTMDIGGGRQFPVDIFAKAPSTRVSYMHTANGDNITGFDGKSGWLAAPARPTRDMSESDLDAARLDADFYFPLHIKQFFIELKVSPLEKIRDRDAYLLVGINKDKPPVKLYFDPQSGLLIRMVRYAVTPLGLNPTQIDYSDYRESGGVKTPFRWTIARPSGRFTIQVAEEKINREIETRKIVRPAGTPEPETPPSN